MRPSLFSLREAQADAVPDRLSISFPCKYLLLFNQHHGLVFPFPGTGAASLLCRCPGDPTRSIGVAGCALGWVDVHEPGWGLCFPFQALSVPP